MSKKIPKPELEVDPLSGRKFYRDSITEQSGGELTDKQRRDALTAIRDGAAFPSKISEAAEISRTNPHSQQSLAVFLGELLKAGQASFNGKTGWKLTELGLKQLPKSEDDDED